MKVRIGFGLGTQSSTADGERLGSLVEHLDKHGFDSLWFAERVSGTTLDPIVAMSFAAARSERLKFGTSVMVLPGRNPVLVAKAIASLDQVSGGRVLPAFGLGAPQLAEHQAFGVERSERAAWFDEALPLIRRLWAEDVVDHHGERFRLEGLRVLPKPVQDPVDVWLGGRARSELRRCGRLGDGWLPSFCTAADVAEGIPVVNDAAAEAGRVVDHEHFGVLLGYTDGPIPDRLVQAVEARTPGRDPADIIAVGRGRLEPMIREFIDAGASKFVLMPFTEPDDWGIELGELADAVLHLET